MTNEAVATRTTIGLSEANHEVLHWLQTEGFFPQMMDAYKFAIALGVAFGQRSSLVNRKTLFNVGSFDPDQSIHAVLHVVVVGGGAGRDVYREAEEYADWGLQRMRESMVSGDFRFCDYFDAVEALKPSS